MDGFTGTLGYSELFSKPELLIVYGACAFLVTYVVNWAMALLIIMLKPFTCAAVLLAFFRPDLAQNFIQQERSRQIMTNVKNLFLGFCDLFLKIAEQFRMKFSLTGS